MSQLPKYEQPDANVVHGILKNNRRVANRYSDSNTEEDLICVNNGKESNISNLNSLLNENSFISMFSLI
jgi:hypothetical protein